MKNTFKGEKGAKSGESVKRKKSDKCKKFVEGRKNVKVR